MNIDMRVGTARKVARRCGSSYPYTFMLILEYTHKFAASNMQCWLLLFSLSLSRLPNTYLMYTTPHLAVLLFNGVRDGNASTGLNRKRAEKKEPQTPLIVQYFALKHYFHVL